MIDDRTIGAKCATIWLIGLFICLGSLSTTTAQEHTWRDEDIGVPYVRNLISTNDDVLASTVRGLYRFDVTDGVWRFTTAETREFDLSFTNIQPGGVLTRESSSGVVRFVIAENVVERRPINYRVEANDSIVGVVTYAGTDPNVIRVDWKSWKTQISYQLDTVVLPDRFFRSPVPCADGSLFYQSGGLVIFFKYGSSPRITRLSTDETYYDSEVYIHGAQTNIVMRTDENVLASSDLGVTWRNIRSGRAEAYSKIYPTNDPDIFYAVEDDRRIHVRLNGVRDDTLETKAPTIEDGAAGPFGWMINTRSMIMHARPTSQDFIRADSGLPTAVEGLRYGRQHQHGRSHLRRTIPTSMMSPEVRRSMTFGLLTLPDGRRQLMHGQLEVESSVIFVMSDSSTLELECTGMLVARYSASLRVMISTCIKGGIIPGKSNGMRTLLR